MPKWVWDRVNVELSVHFFLHVATVMCVTVMGDLWWRFPTAYRGEHPTHPARTRRRVNAT